MQDVHYGSKSSNNQTKESNSRAYIPKTIYPVCRAEDSPQPQKKCQEVSPFDFKAAFKHVLDSRAANKASGDLKNMIRDRRDLLEAISQDIDDRFLDNVKQMVTTEDNKLFGRFFQDNQAYLDRRTDGFNLRKQYLSNYVFNKY
jgi:hypothetical protein